MTNKIHFTKMHGAGNDYIYVDSSLYPISDPAAAARCWSDRHKGIGSDGLVLIGRPEGGDADFTMRIFNADGSEALMCGNASRCIGKYLYEKGLTRQTEIRLSTQSGMKVLRLDVTDGKVERVTVDMGMPVLADESLFRPVAGLPDGTFVSMGNPHYVIFTDEVDGVDDVAGIGQRLECHAAFPDRCNIELACVLPDGTIRTKVWERGSGVTMACGTGACATAVAAVLTGRNHRRVSIGMDGGSLDVEWNSADGHVYLSGSAAFVFEGEIQERF